MTIGQQQDISFEIIGKPQKTCLTIRLYLGNKLISDEPVYLPTYIYALEKMMDKLYQHDFKNPSFQGISPTQVFQKLLLERVNDNDTNYFKHLWCIDETIDQYIIFAIDQGDSTLLVWHCWDKSNCNADHQPKEVYHIDIPKNTLVTTLQSAIETFKSLQ
ncbi:hypothetical protein V6R21_06795 [Limibacter armeniacum]|uniref:hypothetical protein n=1 Tax=Limibacter armeniacum TaxID=466084 RepID=UPI002FE63356